MASRSMAPGAALLRASRVFSIPAALPRPLDDHGASEGYNSDTATLPHPIRQSITTPQSSLERGDWGFKRLLPLRSTTRSSTPVIRVETLDTFEQITEFRSAADHTLSLQKWQEMDMPLSVPRSRRETNFTSASDFKSVFEDEFDSTAQEKGSQTEKDAVRWKFKGPWLAGQTEGEFSEYIQKEVRKRRKEFRNFLKRGCAEAINLESQGAASGKSAEAKSPLESRDITEEQLGTYIQTLREDRAALFKQVRRFLDLPPSPVGSKGFDISDIILSPQSKILGEPESQRETSGPISPYAESGPPKTHPSAGLSYSRTSARTFNHPVYGPQKFPPPVVARVVSPARGGAGTFGAALGVGGFVTRLPAIEQLEQKSFYKKNNGNSVDLVGLSKIDPDNKTGTKLFVRPTYATINPKGNVMLNVSLANPAAVAVLEDKVDELPPPPPPKTINPFGAARSVKIDGTQQDRGSTGYGL